MSQSFVDGVDAGVVGAVQVAAELEVVGRVGEDQVDAVGGAGHSSTSMQSPGWMTSTARERVVGVGLGIAGIPLRYGTKVSQKRITVKLLIESMS